MKSNVYFKKFLLKHDRSLERVAKQTPHLGDIKSFLSKKNVYREINKREFKDLKVLD